MRVKEGEGIEANGVKSVQHDLKALTDQTSFMNFR